MRRAESPPYQKLPFYSPPISRQQRVHASGHQISYSDSSSFQLRDLGLSLSFSFFFFLSLPIIRVVTSKHLHSGARVTTQRAKPGTRHADATW